MEVTITQVELRKIFNEYYGKKDTGIVSIMLEINKRVLREF